MSLSIGVVPYVSCKKLATEKAKMKLLESDAEDKDDKDKGK